jgi:tetratricopeptide (TPR) repeat protein
VTLLDRLRTIRRAGMALGGLVFVLSIGLCLAGVSWLDQIVAMAVMYATVAFGIAVATIERTIVRREGRNFAQASLVGPLAGTRRLYDELAARSPRWTQSVQARVALSNLLLREERFAEARDLLSAIPLRSLPKRVRWLHLDNRAVATAKAGDPALAIPLAKQALACAPANVDPEEVAVTKATLGFAYFLAGRCAEAVLVLEEALSDGTSGDHRASCAFYLGEALMTLGRVEDGVNAYRIACDEAPDSSAAQRARAKLGQVVPYRV